MLLKCNKTKKAGTRIIIAIVRCAIPAHILARDRMSIAGLQVIHRTHAGWKTTFRYRKAIPMRKALLLSALLAGTVFAAAPALADDPTAPPAPFTITGSAGVWSQYRFRGISQSDNKPVFQGSVTVAHSSGFYISTWGSSASANDAVNIGGSEIDVYAGYTHALGKSGVTFDGGLYGYLYPGSARAVGISENYYEVYGSLSKPFGPLTAKAGIHWAPSQSYFTDFH